MSTTRELLSIGYAAQYLQRSPGQITHAASTLGIDPEVTINGVAHYTPSQLARVREALGAPLVEVRGRRGGRA